MTYPLKHLSQPSRALCRAGNGLWVALGAPSRGRRLTQVVLAALMVTLASACGDGARSDRGGGIVADNNFYDSWNNQYDRDLGEATQGDCGSALESAALEVLNRDRTEHGLAEVRCHLGMLDVARYHSDDMISRRFFDHRNPDGEGPSDRMRRAGVVGWVAVGENIAENIETPAGVQAGWMASPGHRANILTAEFTHAAIGVAVQDNRITWTQLLATF